MRTEFGSLDVVAARWVLGLVPSEALPRIAEDALESYAVQITEGRLAPYEGAHEIWQIELAVEGLTWNSGPLCTGQANGKWRTAARRMRGCNSSCCHRTCRCGVSKRPHNKPLERAGTKPEGEDNRRRAGRSAPSR